MNLLKYYLGLFYNNSAFYFLCYQKVRRTSYAELKLIKNNMDNIARKMSQQIQIPALNSIEQNKLYSILIHFNHLIVFQGLSQVKISLS